MSTMLKMTLPEGPACEIAHTCTADAVTCGSEAFRSVTQKHVLQAHRLDSVEAVSLPVLGGASERLGSMVVSEFERVCPKLLPRLQLRSLNGSCGWHLWFCELRVRLVFAARN